jgi:hypothetical protein
MCPVSTQPLKNEYHDTLGGKDGRFLWLTTYHLQVPMSRNLEALTFPEPSGPHRPVMGLLYFCSKLYVIGLDSVLLLEYKFMAPAASDTAVYY